MFVLRKLDRYIIKSYYHNDSYIHIHNINTIMSPDLIYECYGEFIFGKLLIQGNYVITLTKPNGYLIDIIYLHNKHNNLLYYYDSTFNRRAYIKLYNYHTGCHWHLKLFDSNTVLYIQDKWKKIAQCFKYIKDEIDTF